MWYLGDPGTDFYTLRVCDMDGSNIRVLLEDKNVPVVTPFAWSPDGENILVAMSLRNKMLPPDTTRKLALISADDGSVTELKQWKGRQGPVKTEFSPDGKYVAFDLSKTAEPNPKDIYVIELSTGKEVTVVEHPAHDEYLGWTPDGKRLLFASDRTSERGLWSIEIANGRPVGSPVLLKSDFAGSPVGFSDDGSYYFNKWNQARNVSIATLDETGTDFETVPQYVSSQHVNSTSSSDWSPDGQSLAYKMGPEKRGGSSVIGIYSVKTGQERIVKPSMRLRIVPHGRLGSVQWSADGKSLFVSGSSVAHGRGTYKVDIDTGDTQLIIKMQAPRNPQPTLDGKAIYYIQVYGPLIRHDLATGQEEVVHKSTDPMFGLDLSLDGKRLTFYRGTSLVVMSVDSGEVREVMSFEKPEWSDWGLGFPTWTPDGKHVLIAKRDSEIWRVNVETGEQQQIGSEIPGLFRATMHPDGKRMAITTFKPSSELWVMENFLPE